MSDEVPIERVGFGAQAFPDPHDHLVRPAGMGRDNNFTGGDAAANDFRFLILLRGHGFDLGRKAARFCQFQLRLHAITSLIHTH